MLFVAGATAISGAFTDQRDLQSLCDGATLAAANSASGEALHGAGNAGGAIGLSNADEAIAEYLRRIDAGDVRATGQLSADGLTVQLTCVRHIRLAFGSFIGKGDGIDQRAVSSARSPLS
jgi:acyl-coenzyme A thioesterase PaaI-like protein